MKAYVLRNNELELMWSWEAERQPTSEAAAGTPSEVPGEQAPNASASAVETLPPAPPENGMQAALGALNGAIGTKQGPEATVAVEARPIATAAPAPIREAQTLEEWVEAAVAAIGGA